MRKKFSKLLAVLLAAATAGMPASVTWAADTASAEMQAEAEGESAEGILIPDSFSWSGGSGKLKGITCEKIIMKEGQAWAELVFASGHYDYVKVDDTIYYPTVQTEEESCFEVPVTLNKNNEIIGMTTAMSSGHEITYTIYIAVDGMKTGESEDENGEADAGILTSDSMVQDEEAPEITGLTYQGSLKTEYAQYFKLHYYDNGFSLLEVCVPEAGDPEEDGKTSDETEEEASLYGGASIKYLLAPEGAEVPAGAEKTMAVVTKPVSSTYVASSMALKILDKLGVSSRICETNEDGAYEPDFKELVKNQCDFVVVPPEILAEGSEEAGEPCAKLQELGDQLALLGIPVLVDRSSEETEDLGKYEWCKVYGALYGCEDEAGAIYEAAVEAMNK